MKLYAMEKGREVCWDMHLAEKAENVRLQMHKPVRRNVVMECDRAWEGTVGYLAVQKVGEKYRLYYRSSGEAVSKNALFCVAESTDGIRFERPDLHMVDLGDGGKNNVFFTEDRFIDNFSVFQDPNPDCPPEQKYKALSLVLSTDGKVKELALYTAPDGLHFTFARILPIKGVFDTYNVLLWDEKEKLYRAYIRDFHGKDGADFPHVPDEAIMEHAIRDIRLTTSPDLVNWSTPEKLCFGEESEDLQLYTNQVIRYSRADIFLGMPTRYVNRAKDTVNFRYLPGLYGIRKKSLEKGSRLGTAMTDCVLMTSRDGFRFARCDDAFLTPGIEREDNWVYGDCYMAYGMAETACEENPAVKEISLYTMEGYRTKVRKIVRHTVRQDGFFSWRGDFAGGSITTIPITFAGDSLNVNFATSALGSLRVQICSTDGEPLEGYDSGVLFGDALERSVEFAKPLSALAGKPVRLRFTLKDCDLYSFCFT